MRLQFRPISGGSPLLAAVILASFSLGVPARADSNAPKIDVQQAAAQHDGQHDFDFEFGAWKTHVKRLLHPLSGSTTWVGYDGTTVVRKIWNGKANLAELEADGPAGHLEVLLLRLYDPQAHQWSLNTANSRSGTISVPTIGEFKNGRGEFFDNEPFNGRSILVRNVWTDITPNSCRFEQSFSPDGGKTWELNWVATDTQIASPQSRPEVTATGTQQSAAQPGGQHDFDFAFGGWKTHLSQLQHPLTGSTTWVEYEGFATVHKVWNGRASLEEFEARGPSGRIEGLTLRVYNPASHQWNQVWSTSNDGTLSQPMIGEFRDGRASFSTRNHSTGGPFLFVGSGQTLRPTRAASSSHFRLTEARRGRSIGLTLTREQKTTVSKCTDMGSKQRSQMQSFLIPMLFVIAACDISLAQTLQWPFSPEHDARLRDFQVVELRRYTVKPGEREHFATYFDSYFPEAIQQQGAIIAGTFLERKNENVFTWIRGFHTIDDRAALNAAFYYGPLWAERRNTMNDLIVDSDNVLLLRPLDAQHGVTILSVVDPVKESNGAHGVVVAQIFAVKANSIEAFAKVAEPSFTAYRAAGAKEAGILVTMDVKNNFPQLPVRTDGPYLVWLGILKDNQALEKEFIPAAEQARTSLNSAGLLRNMPELVILDPTPRSRLRWLP